MTSGWPAGAGARFFHARLLLVCMQVLARALLKSAVGGGGVELDEAGNGAEAVRRAREGGAGAYDLIITDKQMPVMDGHEVRLR